MSACDNATIAALEARAQRLRYTSLEMIHRREAGHPGGALSAADIITALYFHKMNIDPERPDDPDRDRFILSKGHASAILYAALAERGYFPPEDLEAWGGLDCHLQGHPVRQKTPGVDMTTGVLGHGVCVGAGLALAGRLTGRSFRTYVLIGDGESQGGVIWEGFMTAAKYGLDKLTVVLDYNDVQLDGFVHDIMPLEPIKAKLEAFNLAVLEIDGHDMRRILEALDEVENIRDKTSVILARTVKGKGVGFMEHQSTWHGMAPDAEQLAAAKAELL